MSFTIRRSVKAHRDLLEAWLSIPVHNEDAANRQLDRIEDVFARLAEFPRLGSLRDDISPGLRSFTKDDYLIVYEIREAEKLIVIERVVHGRRDIAALFPETGQ